MGNSMAVAPHAILRRPGTALSPGGGSGSGGGGSGRSSPVNVHVRAVSQLLDGLQRSPSVASGMSEHERAALATALQVLRSARLQDHLATEAGAALPAGMAVGPGDYAVQPFYDSIEEQSQALQAAAADAGVSATRRHRRARSEGGDFGFLLHRSPQQQQRQQPHGSAPATQSARAAAPPGAPAASFRRSGAPPRCSHRRTRSQGDPATPVWSASATSTAHTSPGDEDGEGVGGGGGGADVTFRVARKPTVFRREDGREASLLRGVSFDTQRTLRSLSMQAGGGASQSAPGARGPTGAVGAGTGTLEFAGSLPAATNHMPDFADYKCYIPRAVLKEIFAFSDQPQTQQQQEPAADAAAGFDGGAAAAAAAVAPEEDAVFTATTEFQRPYEAAVLFADMSGFTALTERLTARAGSDGAELLCAALNDFFGVILDIVERYGGDCVKFAGDALCVLWTVEEPDAEAGPRRQPQQQRRRRRSSALLDRIVLDSGAARRRRRQRDGGSGGAGNPWRDVFTLEHAAVAAAACSAEIHRRLCDYPRVHGVRLTVHMGLGAGAIKVLYVGGKFGRWEFVVAGGPMKQIAVAEPLAGSGETVCSPEAWRLLSEYFAGAPVTAVAAGDDGGADHGGAGDGQPQHRGFMVLGAPRVEPFAAVVKAIHAAAETAARAAGPELVAVLDPAEQGCEDGQLRISLAPTTAAAAAASDANDASGEASQGGGSTGGGGTDGDGGSASTAVLPAVAQQRSRYSPSVHLNIGLTRSFIPNAIYQQLAAGYSGGHLVAEMREVSVLFVKISGLDANDSTGRRALKDMQRMMLAVQESTYLFEGSINKLLIDDKGLLILIGFGLPPLAHEDDPLRAVAAACEIRYRLASFAAANAATPGHGSATAARPLARLTTHIGITTGETFCGVVGNRVRREYTVMGDLVNLSARLMGTAGPGAILVDDNTAMRCVRHVQFHTVPPMLVKGKARPVQPFTPDGWYTTTSGGGGGGGGTQSSSRMMSEPHVLGDDGNCAPRPCSLSVAGMHAEDDEGDELETTSNSGGGGGASAHPAPPALNKYFKHILKRSQTIRQGASTAAPVGYAGDRPVFVRTPSETNGDLRAFKAAATGAAAASSRPRKHSVAAGAEAAGNAPAAAVAAAAATTMTAVDVEGEAAAERVRHVYGRHREVNKLLYRIPRCSSGDILAVIGETGIGKSAFLAKAVAHLTPKADHVVVGVDFGDTTGHGQHLPDTATAVTPWRTRMTEVGVLPSFQAWKSAVLQAVAHYLYDHPAVSGDRTVLEAYTQAIVDLVPESLRRHILLIADLFPELHLRSSAAVANAVAAAEQRHHAAAKLPRASRRASPPPPAAAAAEGAATASGNQDARERAGDCGGAGGQEDNDDQDKDSRSSSSSISESRKVELRCRILIGMLRSVAPGKTLIVVLDSCRSFDAFSWTLLGLFSQYQRDPVGYGAAEGEEEDDDGNGDDGDAAGDSNSADCPSSPTAERLGGARPATRPYVSFQRRPRRRGGGTTRTDAEAATDAAATEAVEGDAAAGPLVGSARAVGPPPRALLPGGGKVLVVVMSRPMNGTSHKYRDFAWTVQRAAQASGLIHLGPLERKHRDDMVFRHLEARRVPEEVLAFVAVHSHGNPLHLIELCRHLLAEQLVHVLNGECRFSSRAARLALAQSRAELRGTLLHYPRVLVQNARSRLDHLRPAEQVITKIASVLPRCFLLWQLLFVVNDRSGGGGGGAGARAGAGEGGQRRSQPSEFVLDVASSTYRSLEQLVLSGILVVLKGAGADVLRRAEALAAAAGPGGAGEEEMERFDEYELDLPLPADCVLTFHSATVRACASTLLLSTQKTAIRRQVREQFAPT